MKQNFHGFFFFILFIFLLFSQSAPATFPPSKQGLQETHNNLIHGIIQENSWPDSPYKKNGEDEEEWERRMMLEAHLDYVYTENEKP